MAENNKKFNPLVSIVIPVYNGSNYLREAIDSALQQTYKNIEIIVINDGSNDNGATAKIAKSYGKKIRYFEKPNGGVATALNMGIQKMRGVYFSWLSHDDLYKKNKIATQIDYIQKHPKLSEAILYSDFTTIDKNNKKLADIRIKHVPSRLFIYELINSHPVHGCTLLIPKKYFEKQKEPFNPKLRTTQDYTLWFELAKKYQFIHLKKILIKSRIHSEQDTLKKPDTVIRENNLMYSKFIRNIADVYKKTPTTKKIFNIYLEAAIGLIYKGYPTVADEAFSLYLKKEKNFVKKIHHGSTYVIKKRTHALALYGSHIKRSIFHIG